MNTKITESKEVNVSATPEDLKGRYSNAVKVVVSDSETVIDFALLINEEANNSAQLVNRIVVTNEFASKIAQSINDTLQKHSKKKSDN